MCAAGSPCLQSWSCTASGSAGTGWSSRAPWTRTGSRGRGLFHDAIEAAGLTELATVVRVLGRALEAHDSSGLPLVERIGRYHDAALLAAHMLRHYTCEPVPMPKSMRGLSTQLLLAHAYNSSSIWQYFLLEMQQQQYPGTPLTMVPQQVLISGGSIQAYSPWTRRLPRWWSPQPVASWRRPKPLWHCRKQHQHQHQHQHQQRQQHQQQRQRQQRRQHRGAMRPRPATGCGIPPPKPVQQAVVACLPSSPPSLPSPSRWGEARAKAYNSSGGRGGASQL